MTNTLKEHFPMLRERGELMEIIHKDSRLKKLFMNGTKKGRRNF